MFVLTTVSDTIRIHPSMFALPVLSCIQTEIDKKYPNRVIMDVGLCICRYAVLQIGDGVCVAGDGGSHHETIFQLVVYRPFVDEVCVGIISKCNEDGLKIQLGEGGFFYDVFVPAYWMLRPSRFDETKGLWFWTPDYSEGDEEGDGDGDDENAITKKEETDEEKKDAKDNDEPSSSEPNLEDDENAYEMEIGAPIRFRVKSINFTQVTNTAKGVQATTTSTASSLFNKSAGGLASADTRSSSASLTNGVKEEDEKGVRKRSSSVDLTDSENIPASMHIIASICEDGLGVTSWWTTEEEEEEEEEEGYEEEEGEELEEQWDEEAGLHEDL